MRTSDRALVTITASFLGLALGLVEGVGVGVVGVGLGLDVGGGEGVWVVMVGAWEGLVVEAGAELNLGGDCGGGVWGGESCCGTL